ncbi:MAG: shikimate dehydrogenase [Solirubrobacteraceae bacterium]|jgi:shikimate dehydrogenase|nr:shikimate dehydrogenase [Solirubrobacteraceae bacterium]
MHEAAYAAAGIEGWRYQRLPVPPERFAETVRALPAAGFAGANVTLPHKAAALALADSATEAARAIGAANSLTFADRAIEADNTDAPGFLAALDTPAQGLRATVLGAGGSARAVVWALREAGAADVAVWNRTPERARTLADELGSRAVSAPEPGDLLVNCTSVGLDPGADPFEHLPLTSGDLAGWGRVVDLAYAGDGATAFLRAARDAGATTVDGLEVLVRQGALSFERWTGVPAPLDAMRAGAGVQARGE